MTTAMFRAGVRDEIAAILTTAFRHLATNERRIHPLEQGIWMDLAEFIEEDVLRRNNEDFTNET